MADSVIIRIDGDDRGYQKALENTKKGMEGLNKAAKTVAIGVTAAAAAIIGTGVKYNAEMEQYKAGFETMLGSAEKADSVISDLKSFAEKTPFELTDLANASTTLLAFGEDVESLMPDLKMLGDISLGNQEKFKSLALVFGQVQSQGKLMGQDLLQMINSGFNPLKVISEQTGESMTSLKDKMSEGQISFEMVADAMRIATSEGGQFYNAMEKQSQTLMGQWSTLKDNIVSLAGEISSGISGYLTETALPWLIEKVEELKQMWEDGTLLSAINGIISALAGFGTAIVALNLAFFINDIVQVIKGVEGFVAVTKAGTAAQAAFNAVAGVNPYVLLATALIALITGIGTYSVLTNKSADDTNRLSESFSKLEEQTNKNLQSIQEKEDADLADIAVTEKKIERLLALDRELKENSDNTEANKNKKAELKALVDELNKVSPAFQLAINDETGALENQTSAVEELGKKYIELAKAKAYAEAYSEKIKALALENIEIENILEKYDPDTDTYDGKEIRSTKNPINAAKKLTGERQAEGWIGKEELDIEGKKKKYAENEKAIEQFSLKLSEYEKELCEDTNGFFRDQSDETTRTINTNTERQTQKKETEQEKQLRNLQHNHKIGEISDEEYYKKLEAHRDKYFTEGSEQWQKFTEEIAEYTKKVAREAAREAEEVFEDFVDKFEELEKTQKSLSDRFKDENDLFFEKTRSFYDKDGNLEFSTTSLELTDFKAETAELNAYSQSLAALKERADIPKEFFNQIRDMSIEDGAKFVDKLLTLTPEALKEYIKAWEENQEAIETFSGSFFTDEAQQIADEITKVFGDNSIPEGFFNMGRENAEAYVSGYTEFIRTKFKPLEAVNDATGSISVNPSVTPRSEGGYWLPRNEQSATTINNFNTTVNTSNTTVSGEINAAHEANVKIAQRSGYDV